MSDRRDWRQRKQGRKAPAPEAYDPPVPPPARRRGWRRQADDAAGRPRVGGTMFGWLTPQSREKETSLFWHYLKLVLLGACVISLVVSFVVYVLPPRTDLLFIPVAVSKYEEPISPNAYAWEDVNRLETVNPENIRVRPLPNKNGSISSDRFEQHLSEQFLQEGPGGPNNDVVVVYLSAHGVVDENDEPCLLFSDSPPLASSKWYRVRKLLNRMKTFAGPDKQSGSKSIKKVLVLDSGRMDENWRMGLLGHRFPERLEEVVREVNVPDLYVLHSSSPQQINRTSPARQGSLFGYFFAQGLGKAGDRNGDGTVTLREIFEYVRTNVSEQSLALWASPQEPMLMPDLPEANDFALVFTPGGPKTQPETDLSHPGTESLRPRAERIGQLWNRADALREAGVGQRPIEWAELERKLLRLEQFLVGGRSYDEPFEETAKQVGRLLRRLSEPERAHPAQPLNLPLSRQLVGVSPDQRGQAQAAWDMANRPADEAGKVEAKKHAPVGYLAAADVCWSALRASSAVGRRDLAQVFSFLEANPEGRPTPDLIEIQMLRMLHRDLDLEPHREDFEPPVRRLIAQAIRARHLAEEAASPADVRTHYWIQQTVDRADRERRLAEDRLVIGNPQSLSRAKTAWDPLDSSVPAEGSYQLAIDRARLLDERYALRDEVWAELPYLAQWLIGQQRPSKSIYEAERSAEIVKELVPLIRANHRLAEDLDRADRFDQVPNASDVARPWEDLKLYFAGYCRYLEDYAQPDAQIRREIADVLRVPLIDPRQRAALMDIYIRLLSSRGTQVNADRIPDSRETPSVFAPRAILDRSRCTLVEPAYRHPALVDDSSATRGGQVRQHIEDMVEVVPMLQQVTEDRFRDAAQQPRSVRLGLSQADGLLRAAAPLASWRIPSDIQSTRELYNLDRHYELIWHSWRTVEDFWGQVAEEGSRSPDYFQAASETYSRLARQFRGSDDGLRYQRTDIGQLRVRRANAASAMAHAGVRSSFDALLKADRPVMEEIREMPHSVHLAWHEDLPTRDEADPSVFVQSNGQLLELMPSGETEKGPRLRRRGWQQGDEPEYFEHLIPSDRQDDLRAVALLRGHRWFAPFRIPTIHQYVRYPVRVNKAKVEVRGDGKRRGHVMFILDCSGSMHDNGRMDTAKDALREVLRTLERERQYRVGLRAYGRRSKYRGSRNLRPGQKPNDIIPRDQNVNIDPDIDVETVVPMQPVAESSRQIRKSFPILTPFGQTPLYYAIYQSLRYDGFAATGDVDWRQIIVITDGENKLSPFADPAARKYDADKVEEAWRELEAKKRGVRIDVIGMDLEVSRELQQLAEITDGKTYFATGTDVQQLRDTMREALRLATYSVSKSDALTTAEPEKRELGEICVVDCRPGEPTPYDVSIQTDASPLTAAVQVEGGEHLVIVYDKVGKRLYFPEYGTELEFGLERRRGQVHSVVGKRRGERFQVQSLLPLRVEQDGQDWDFFVYVQKQMPDSDDYLFTPRPKHVWATIQPKAGNRELGPPYEFFDCDFLPNEPVPVFRFRAKNWPETADAAVIQLWFAVDERDVPRDAPRNVTNESFEVSGVSFAVSPMAQAGEYPYRVVVTEKHPSSGSEPVRVALFPVPDRVERRQYVGAHAVKHIFDYREEKAAALWIAPRLRITDNAIPVPNLEVTVQPP